VIKFFCLNCGQKLAVDDEGVGVVVSCTNCEERIIVPPRSVTASDFTGSRTRERAVQSAHMELMPPTTARVESLPSPVRASLIPHLARMMMNRLVQTLFAQRANLLDTQAEATHRMTELEERIAKAQVNMHKKLAVYEKRIGELEQQLAAKEEENHDLKRASFQRAVKPLGAGHTGPPPGRVNLRDAGFLLHA
jgi:DNA-directed RNA polymerase subunit RPC12/RpoP